MDIRIPHATVPGSMQIEALKTFCDVVRLRSFSRGAEENNVSQSAASLIVHQLEDRLGVNLIDRSQRPWKLTVEGKLYYEGCREVVERYFQVEERVKGFHGEIRSVVRIASIYSVGLGPMNEYIERFSREHPGSKIEIEYLHPDRVYEKVAAEDADIGIVSFPQSKRDLSVIPWCTEPMVIACYPQHPFAKQKIVKLSQIEGEKFVAFQQGLVIRREIDRFLKQHGIGVDVILEFDNIEAIKTAVEVGSGISILPQPTFDREVKTKTLVSVRLRPNGFERPLGILYRRGKKLSPNAARFIDLLRQEKNSVSNSEVAA